MIKKSKFFAFTIAVVSLIIVNVTIVNASNKNISMKGEESYQTLLAKVNESDNVDSVNVVEDVNKNESLRQLKTRLKYKESKKVALIVENEKLKEQIEEKKEAERQEEIRKKELKKQEEARKKEEAKKAKASNKGIATKKGNKRLIGTFNGSAYDDSPQSQGKWVGKTATGVKPQRGVVAVDPKVIPLGSSLYIESMDDYPDYGYAYAGDTGGAIKGRRIDLFMNSRSECYAFGRRQVRVYIID